MSTKKDVIKNCIVLKAFVDQKECVKQFIDKDSIKIAGTYFSFPRAVVGLEDDDVSKELINTFFQITAL